MADIIKTSTQAGNEQQTSTDNRDQTVDTQEEQKPINIDDYPVDDKGNHIVPDEIFFERYRELPTNTRNETMKYRVFNHGYVRCLNNSEDAREIQRMGAEASNAKQAHRRTMRESLDYILAKQVENPEEMIGANADKLPKDCTLGDLLTMSMVNAAVLFGDTKAATFVRDTAGEKPVDQQEISANVMTDADRALLAKVSKRVDTED